MDAETREALFRAFVAGFNVSGEGWNGEYPYGDKCLDPTNELSPSFEEWLRYTGQVRP